MIKTINQSKNFNNCASKKKLNRVSGRKIRRSLPRRQINRTITADNNNNNKGSIKYQDVMYFSHFFIKFSQTVISSYVFYHTSNNSIKVVIYFIKT